ncbi:MAG: hypothetical protein RL542_1100 [Bacteroidota bacterium]|jgi:hypothetical protein
MQRIEKFINILFYNFHIVDYNYRKLLLVYLNPFCWIVNFSKIKLGFKIFTEHMEKNFPTFLNLYRNDNFSKLFFMIFLILLNCSLINLILKGLGVNLAKNYFIVLIVSGLLSLTEAFVFVFQEEKFYKYHKEFNVTKKYDFPIITFLSIIAFFYLWISTFLIW